ncbi:MAG: histone deacetylase [Candidatus Bathyarchaeia archaeon]
MAKTAIIFTPKYYSHKPGPSHPETPKRLRVVMDEIARLDLFSVNSECKLVRPNLASTKDLELVHVPEHTQLVKRICEHGGGLLDVDDTVVSPESFETARYAVGGTLKAVDLVINKNFRNAFALVRPPGHHAGSYYAAGFCVFNNVAIAATHLIRRLGIERILILDMDAHHGNGTQEIFYETKNVLYVSLHEDPLEFPGTGFVDEIGEGQGLGHNVNIPFPFRAGDKAYLKAFDEVIVPIVQQYAPQFVLVSAGYDSVFGDSVAKLNLSAAAYSLIFEKMLGLASTFCEDKFVAVLEGGYNLKKLGKLVVSSISKMAGFPYLMKDGRPPVNHKAEKKAEKVIREVKKVHSAFWDLES